MSESAPTPENLGLSRSPLHGYRGGSSARTPTNWPRAFSVALTREVGARGTSIAKRVGKKLGWQVYSQDLLEYIAQEGTFRQDVWDLLPKAAHEWIEQRLESLQKQQQLSNHASIVDLARMVLAIGAPGEVVLLGRGAGCILPMETTVNVRLVAPLPDRIAYMSQYLRLTEEEAAEQVRKRDARRAEFMTTHFHRKPADVHHYDLVLNTALLGEEACSELIANAVKLKISHAADEL